MTTLRRLRLARGLTQLALAQKVGVVGPYIYQLETGRRTPSLATVRKLALALGVTPARLIQ